MEAALLEVLFHFSEDVLPAFYGARSRFAFLRPPLEQLRGRVTTIGARCLGKPLAVLSGLKPLQGRREVLVRGFRPFLIRFATPRHALFLGLPLSENQRAGPKPAPTTAEKL